jgi:hypothetical protein
MNELARGMQMLQMMMKGNALPQTAEDVDDDVPSLN